MDYVPNLGVRIQLFPFVGPVTAAKNSLSEISSIVAKFRMANSGSKKFTV